MRLRVVGAGALSLVVVVASVAVALAGGSAQGTQAGSAGNGLIAFVRYDGIYVMRADGSGAHAIRRGRVASTADDLAWSADGRKLAFATRNVQSEIWVVDADGTDLTRLVVTAEHGLRAVMSPTWSPDGRRIAFAGYHAEQRDPDIWVVNADGSGQRRLARTPRLWELEVDWSPGGSRIAFTDVGGWMCRLYVMNTDGTTIRKLTPAGWELQDATPDWSPDGRRIALTHWPLRDTGDEHGSIAGAEIWVTEPGGGTRVRLTRNDVRDSYPTWSPDGRKIAFVRGGDKETLNPATTKRDSSEIYVMNADGTGVTRLTSNRVGEAVPAWQPIPQKP